MQSEKEQLYFMQLVKNFVKEIVRESHSSATRLRRTGNELLELMEEQEKPLREKVEEITANEQEEIKFKQEKEEQDARVEAEKLEKERLAEEQRLSEEEAKKLKKK